MEISTNEKNDFKNCSCCIDLYSSVMTHQNIFSFYIFLHDWLWGIREGYTYRKLNEQRPRSTSSSAVAATPAATTRCSSSPVPHPLAKVSLGRIDAFPVGTTHKSMDTPTSSRSTPTTTKATPTHPKDTPTINRITKAREKCNHGSHPDLNKDQENEHKIVSVLFVRIRDDVSNIKMDISSAIINMDADCIWVV